jgi:hypothetical protein
VEARAYLGLLDALERGAAHGRVAVQTSLDRAQKSGQFSLEARCRVYLARIDIRERRFEDAIRALDGVARDGKRTLSPEVLAQVHYWRSQALLARGDRTGAEAEERTARKLLEQLRESLPEQYRDGFASRADIRLVIQ